MHSMHRLNRVPGREYQYGKGRGASCNWTLEVNAEVAYLRRSTTVRSGMRHEVTVICHHQAQLNPAPSKFTLRCLGKLAVDILTLHGRIILLA